MDFFEVINKRHSVRSFQNKNIEEEKLQEILAAAITAPSAGNLQAYEIFLLKDENKKKRLVQAAGEQEWIAEAPVVLVFCAHPPRSSWQYGERGERLYSLQDATIAASYAQLAATSLGLASCWVGAFYEDKVLEILGNPPALIPICIMPIGYSAEEAEGRERKIEERRKIEEIVHIVHKV